MKTKFAFVFVVLAVVLAACGPQATPTPAPEPTPMPKPTAVPTEEPEMPKTIVDIAVEDGRFTTLVAAMQAAGLVDTLSSEGPFTVFAPTDDAFAVLPAGTVEGLLADIPALTDILLYHVVSGKVMAAEVGEIKRELAFHGDVLNTAARIQKQCKRYRKQILVTRNFAGKLAKEKTAYKLNYIDFVKFPGKDRTVKIYEVYLPE